MQIHGSDYIEYTKGVSKGMELIETGIDPNFGLLVVCGMNFGLRISDLLGISYDQLKSGEFLVTEKKTGKGRKIVVNSTVREALDKMIVDGLTEELGGYVFTSQKGSVYSSQHVNRLMKKYLAEDGIRVSSHSLRKGFGRRYYEKKGRAGLTVLQLQLNHASVLDTLKYIGVTQEELDDMYEDIT